MKHGLRSCVAQKPLHYTLFDLASFLSMGRTLINYAASQSKWWFFSCAAFAVGSFLFCYFKHYYYFFFNYFLFLFFSLTVAYLLTLSTLSTSYKPLDRYLNQRLGTA